VMNQYNKSGTDEEEPQTLVIEQPPRARHQSQTDFDDRPLPNTNNVAAMEVGSSTSRQSQREVEATTTTTTTTAKKAVQKRPFLQRSRSPVKINNSRTNSKTLTSGSGGGGGRNSNNTFAARSPPAKRAINARLPDKRATVSSSSISKLVSSSSRTPSMQRASLPTSSFNKSTPHLATTATTSKQPTPTSSTRSSSHGETPPQRTPNSSSSDEARHLIDTVPDIPTKSKLVRTPQMKRKVIAVNSDETAINGGHFSEAGVGLHKHPQRSDSIDEVEIPEEEGPLPPPMAPPPTAFTRPPPGTAASTASSVVSVANLHFLPVKTVQTLKSPMDGNNLGPFHKPEEFLTRTMDNLASGDWEANVNGMTAVLRFARHHHEYLLVEYKPLLQHVMRHVMNLRSQVIINRRI
jgi:hypothetical protein